jgi:protein-S-isoprenylcysteine O-methyltransferase Ste14
MLVLLTIVLLLLIVYEVKSFYNPSKLQIQSMKSNKRNIQNCLNMSQLSRTENDVFGNIVRIITNIKDSLFETFEKSIENTKVGQPGKKGEFWFFIQITVLSLILSGKLVFQIFPLLGFIVFMSSVVALITGTTLVVTSISSLKDNVNFFSAPVNDILHTDGSYEFVRHPLYGGLILSAFGFSILTNSVERMLFSIALTLILVRKITISFSKLTFIYLNERIKEQVWKKLT